MNAPAVKAVPQQAGNVSMEAVLGQRFGLNNQKGSSDIFAKAKEFRIADMGRAAKIWPYYQTIEQNEGSIAIIGGKECIMLGSNNYLGLTIHPEVRHAAESAVRKFGTSLTGSRLLNGTHFLHEKLEQSLAEFLGKEAALVVTTGYQANLAVISALVGKHDALILDRLNHASIHDGARLGKGVTLHYQHNDMADLERQLASLPADQGKLILMDGVFSMEGDICPLPEICALAKRYGARVAVDDAHATGILGQGGQGTAHHFGLENEVDLVIGTFSKSLASVGGFVAGSAKVIDYIKHFGRSVVFSASLPPASTAAALKALEILKREPERVTRVNANAQYMREGLASLGFNIGHSTTPIIPIVIGEELTTLRLWRELLEEGVYVNSVLHPAVPRDQSLLRTSYTSEHTREHLDRALEIFAKFKRKYRL